MSVTSERVVIGMDPHKRSATIEVMSADETIRGGGRFGTDRDGYAAMLRYGRRWPERVWAIEGCAGIGKHIANRLLADGEQVACDPRRARRSCRRGPGSSPPGRAARPTPPTRTRSRWSVPGWRGCGRWSTTDGSAVLRVLVDRRRSLGEDHTRMVSQLHQLLLELIPGGAKKDLSARQAKALLAKVRPRDAAGSTRRRVAAELIADLERVYARKKAADKELASAGCLVRPALETCLESRIWQGRLCADSGSLSGRSAALASLGEAPELPFVHAGHPVPADLGRWADPRVADDRASRRACTYARSWSIRART